MDKETYSFMYPTRIASFSFRFSDHAMQWLCGTTTDDNSRETGNFTLFGDLLARMALTDGAANGFHRPLMLSAGQTQSRNSFLRNGTWAGSAYATCLPRLRTWGLSTPAVRGLHP